MRRLITARSYPRSSSCNLGPRVLREAREVVPEHRGELPRLPVVGGRVLPRRARAERARLDARHLDRHPGPEDVVGPVLRLVEATLERSMEERAGRRDRHPAAARLAGGPAGPAGVDEPDRSAVLVELLAELPRV